MLQRLRHSGWHCLGKLPGRALAVTLHHVLKPPNVQHRNVQGIEGIQIITFPLCGFEIRSTGTASKSPRFTKPVCVDEASSWQG